MRILCLVTDGFGGQGGIALHCRHLLRAFCASDQVQTVHALPRIEPHYPEVLPEKLEYLDCCATSPIKYLLTLVKETTLAGRWDMVVCEHINLLWLAACVARVHKAKLLLVIHGFESWEEPGRLSRWSLRRVNHVISVSRVTKDRFLVWSGVEESRITVIANAIELEKFSPGRRPEYLQDRYGVSTEPVIMTLGRLSEHEQSKGFDLVIAAMPDLLKIEPDLIYLIAGDGEDRHRLERLSCERGVSQHVKFCGEVSNAEKADHYRLADAYIMPSRLEGFGYVFLEALASGLPVVGSQIDGSQDALLNGELGELVDPDDSEALSTAIIRALQKPKIVPEQLQLFSLERFNREVGELLRRAVG